MSSLENLSTELLLKIFKSLDVRDLCRVKQVCKRFSEILDRWGHLFIKIDNILVSNQCNDQIIKRSSGILLPFEKLRLSRNWQLGIYDEYNHLNENKKYMPWLQLEKDVLWVSRIRCVNAYRRTENRGIDTQAPLFCVKGVNNEDISRFILKNDLLLAGQIDGTLWLWSISKQEFVFAKKCHCTDINDVDFCDNTFFSGSRDSSMKIWKLANNNLHYIDSFTLNDRVWCMSLNEQSPWMALGTTGRTRNVTLVDVTRLEKVAFVGLKGSGGTLSLKWENPHLLWTCDYSGRLCRWDFRTGHCEKVLSDPFGATVYSFDYDYNNTIISGTYANGRAVLWDIRQKTYQNIYYLKICRRKDKSSPIYSLAFDSKYLFATTHQNVNVLDFSIYGGEKRIYANF